MKMKLILRRSAPLLAIALALAAPLSGTSARAAEFEDQTCPNANDAGRHLNSLNDSGKATADDAMAAAQAMVTAYRECVRGYDNDVYNQPEAAGQQHNNGTPIGRIYARLALARSLQRVGIYDIDLKKYADAKAAYDEALKHLDEMKSIPSLEMAGPLGGGSPEHTLLTKGDDLRKEIEAGEAALPK
jgi:hypothetical protein